MNQVPPAHADLLALTADIVVAHVGNNTVAISDIPALIAGTFAALARLGSPAPVPEAAREPAVPVRNSVKSDHIVCLEDGKKLKMLKRHLMTRYNMTPEAYRARWSLPADYPMVAPDYAAERRSLALKIGLGTKRNVRRA
jgi:predicted transcriptional regulator